MESPLDGVAWWAAVHGVAKSRARLKWLSSSSSRGITVNFLFFLFYLINLFLFFYFKWIFIHTVFFYIYNYFSGMISRSRFVWWVAMDIFKNIYYVYVYVCICAYIYICTHICKRTKCIYKSPNYFPDKTYSFIFLSSLSFIYMYAA